MSRFILNHVRKRTFMYEFGQEYESRLNSYILFSSSLSTMACHLRIYFCNGYPRRRNQPVAKKITL